MVSAAATSFEQWRDNARALLRAGVPSSDVVWSEGAQQPLFEAASTADGPPLTVPRKFLELAGIVACHRDPKRWALLYDVLYRITHGERHLLEIEVDRSVRGLLQMRKDVLRDTHHMQAFVRFRKVVDDYGERFVAWYRPDH